MNGLAVAILPGMLVATLHLSAMDRFTSGVLLVHLLWLAIGTAVGLAWYGFACVIGWHLWSALVRWRTSKTVHLQGLILRSDDRTLYLAEPDLQTALTYNVFGGVLTLVNRGGRLVIRGEHAQLAVLEAQLRALPLMAPDEHSAEREQLRVLTRQLQPAADSMLSRR